MSFWSRIFLTFSIEKDQREEEKEKVLKKINKYMSFFILEIFLKFGVRKDRKEKKRESI